MKTSERHDVRTTLLAQGFARTGSTPDLDAKGDYTETWTHTDGSIATIAWAPKTDSSTPAHDETATDTATAMTAHEAQPTVQDAVLAVLDAYAREAGLESTDMSQKAWKQTFLNLLADVRATVVENQFMCDFCEKPVAEDDGYCRGCGSSENVREIGTVKTTDPYGNPLSGDTETLDSDDDNLAEHTARIRSHNPIISAPGMYDEPDMGLSLPIAVSPEEDTIR